MVLPWSSSSFSSSFSFSSSSSSRYPPTTTPPKVRCLLLHNCGYEWVIRGLWPDICPLYIFRLADTKSEGLNGRGEEWGWSYNGCTRVVYVTQICLTILIDHVFGDCRPNVHRCVYLFVYSYVYLFVCLFAGCCLLAGYVIAPASLCRLIRPT